jgi:hypothetical protein
MRNVGRRDGMERVGDKGGELAKGEGRKRG